MKFTKSEMIIFDLDGTLADCEHRRHFVVKPKQPDCTCDPESYGFDGQSCGLHDYLDWKPDWKSFYEACDKDTPIKPAVSLLYCLCDSHRLERVQIWSGRCESVREKTVEWLLMNTCFDEDMVLKMRPLGDNTPDDELKERWLDETYEETKWGRRTPIEFVFDDRPKVIRMWRRHGIFVFNCAQHDEEF